ncbi:TetR family transcriptional regulator C-terminal domain-containing protein [Nitratireductor sp. XY-223]|uniref:TetR family transcriptional regulator C-terminal domain-containing protein n=1 Tax=Nitratireductor sp. XY-223 TaxID=2561926 RepID=UPI0010AA48F1|nr:TetR family transcriptional regulator C-terminal domain-containing protein [Nitratireductor sp. XY-223]
MKLKTEKTGAGVDGRQRKRVDQKQVLMRAQNTEKLLKAGERVFSIRGFDGATTAEIAKKAGVSKSTLHYYFGTKEEIYEAVMNRILDLWVSALEEIDADVEPHVAIQNYVARKIEYSRIYPEPTRLWAMEMTGGARHFQAELRQRVFDIVEEKCNVIDGWIAAGKMEPVNPHHLLFLLWASTQTLAEDAAQAEMVLKKSALDKGDFEDARQLATRIFLRGLNLNNT